jgi:hypothetical protein
MANALFDAGREGILDTTIDVTGDVRAMLVKSTYTVDLANHTLRVRRQPTMQQLADEAFLLG